ncbi:hypothetical protein AB6A40_005471 [Gnathostoma spinigerum]|uniref:Alpha/beta hydrolase fold-3 domain-containing protein n=1 Tax=Gnathostoma spinigerum TaxID=75299 RepID=A0ABD6EHR5_9BILA
MFQEADWPTLDWLLLSLTMTLCVMLSIAAATVCFISLLHISLPVGIADRHKLHFFEFLLRMGNEVLGWVVELLFGPVIRNKFTRIIISIPFLLRRRPPSWVTVTNETLNGVATRIYRPKQRSSNAAIVFIHGGGWATMNPEYYDALVVKLIHHLGVLVISIDYQLSPESPFPGPVEECDKVITGLMLKDYTKFDIDPGRICVMGDSAGGNLGAVICQRCLRRKGPMPKCQVLLYPVIHGFDLKSPSYQMYYKLYNYAALLSPHSMARWILLYLGIPATQTNVRKLKANKHIRPEERKNYRSLFGHELLPSAFVKSELYDKPADNKWDEELAAKFRENGYNPDFAPIMGTELEGLSPAMVVTCGFDVLRDEGALYVRHLREYSVPVLWNHYPSAYHGVLNMPRSDQRDEIVKDIVNYLVKAL